MSVFETLVKFNVNIYLSIYQKKHMHQDVQSASKIWLNNDLWIK